MLTCLCNRSSNESLNYNFPARQQWRRVAAAGRDEQRGLDALRSSSSDDGHDDAQPRTGTQPAGGSSEEVRRRREGGDLSASEGKSKLQFLLLIFLLEF